MIAHSRTKSKISNTCTCSAGASVKNGEISMTPDKIFVTLLGLAAIAYIVWFFWMVKKLGVKAAVSSSGYQELMVLVKGGYTPDVIVVEKDRKSVV